jgi:hypothetical protein
MYTLYNVLAINIVDINQRSEFISFYMDPYPRIRVITIRIWFLDPDTTHLSAICYYEQFFHTQHYGTDYTFSFSSVKSTGDQREKMCIHMQKKSLYPQVYNGSGSGKF